MAITPIAFVGQAYKSRNPTVNSQELVNLIGSMDQSGGKSVLSLIGRPCFSSVFADLGARPIRGQIEVSDTLYSVQGDKFHKVLNDGTSDILGTLDTIEGNVGMAWNGKEIMIVDGVKGYIYNPSTGSFGAIVSAGFLGANDVTFLDQFFVTNVPDTGQAQSSGIRDGINWNALDIATAEGSPDNLVKPIAIHSDLWLMGQDTCEPWYYASLPSGFPFRARDRINMGLAARWGAVIADNALYWPAKNKEGLAGIVVSRGGTPSKISTPAIDYALSTYSTIADCIGFGFTLEDHTFVGFTFPSGNKTWVYDVATGMWSEWRSAGIGRFRAAFPVFVNGRHLMGDTTSGKIYEIKFGVYSDAGETVPRIRTTQHLSANGRDVTIHRLWIEFEPGVGLATGQGEDPMAMLEISRNGGFTFGNEMWRPLGKSGEFSTRAVWDRLGMGRDFVFRLTITDPVKTTILSAFADISAGSDL